MRKILMLIAAFVASLPVSAVAIQPAAAGGAPMGFLLMCLEHPKPLAQTGKRIVSMQTANPSKFS